MARVQISIEEAAGNGGQVDDMVFQAGVFTVNMMFDNTGREVLFVRNTGGLPETIHIESPEDKHGRSVTTTKTLAPGDPKPEAIGFFKPEVYNQTEGDDVGKVYVNFPSGGGLEVAVVRMAK